jgi:hypothetical protein
MEGASSHLIEVCVEGGRPRMHAPGLFSRSTSIPERFELLAFTVV